MRGLTADALFLPRCNNDHRVARFRQDRYQALLHYSGGDIACACCGERHVEFLGLDHVNDDGAVHRRAINRRGGSGFYSWLRTTSYSYQDLVGACHNCNMARAMYGRALTAERSGHLIGPVAQRNSRATAS